MTVDEEPRLLFTNRAQFAELTGETYLLFYNGEAFDSENDARLYELFARSPYDFDNRTQLREYEALIERDAFELRAHPDQAAARALAAADLTAGVASNVFVFVYQRISGSRFTQSPFANLQSAGSAILFHQYAFDPYRRATPLWHWSKRLGNSSVGLLGVRFDDGED